MYISQDINNCKYIAAMQPRTFHCRGRYGVVYKNIIITFVCATSSLFPGPHVTCVKLSLSSHLMV